MSSVTRASRVSELDAEAHIAQYVTVLAHLLLWAVQRACRRFASGNVTKAECPDWKRAYAPSTAHISPFTARCSGCGSPSARLMLEKGEDFIAHDGGPIELTSTGLKRLVAGHDVVVEIDKCEVLVVRGPKAFCSSASSAVRGAAGNCSTIAC